jgi:chemotaxis protein histidine kinase CheA
MWRTLLYYRRANLSFQVITRERRHPGFRMPSDTDFIDIFLEEAETLLTVLHEGLFDLEDAPSDREIVQRLLRSAETFQSAASCADSREITVALHAFADELHELIASSRTPTNDELRSMRGQLIAIESSVADVAATSGRRSFDGVRAQALGRSIPW